jgi:hypothetical protein
MVEINLSSIIVQAKMVSTWTADLNFSYNREEITALPGGKIIGNGWFIGQPLTVIYDVKKIGVWQTEDSVKGNSGRPNQSGSIPWPDNGPG